MSSYPWSCSVGVHVSNYPLGELVSSYPWMCSVGEDVQLSIVMFCSSMCPAIHGHVL